MIDDRPIHVRPTREEDASSVAALLTELGYPFTAEVILAQIRKMLSGEVETAFVAIVDDTIIGGAVVEIARSSAEDVLARLPVLAVHPDFRRHHVGEKLLQSVADYADRHQCRAIEVTAVDDVPENLSFYIDLGFVRQGRYLRKNL